MDAMSVSSVSPPAQPLAAVRLGAAGLAGVGVSFGLARYGYGLFLPEIRAEFGLSVARVGLIGSASYAGYLAALVLVGMLATRVGPRALVAAGGGAATLGTALVGLAPTADLLTAGLVLAGTSPGWIWASYSDAAVRMVPAERRERVLAVIPAGTAFGVVVAGPLALVAHGPAWRAGWLVFAGLSLAATWYNLRVLPVGPPPRVALERLPRVGPGWFLRRPVVGLYGTALSYGVVGSGYWLLAAEAVASAGAPGTHPAALFWTLTGAAGLAGVFAGTGFARLGLRRAHALLFGSLAVAAALLAVAPGELAAVAGSALLYGPAFMAVSALLAVWSYRVFPERPTTGFSATVFFLGVGAVAGPAVIGLVADRYDLRTAFLLAAAVAVATVSMRPGHTSGPATPAARPGR